MPKNIHTILITGGAGFIGLKTAMALASRGYRVIVFDNLLPQVHGTNVLLNEELRELSKVASVIIADVLNADNWRKVLPETDAVLHLAALTGTGQSMYETYNYSKVNVCGTSIFLDLLPEFKTQIRRVVVASSRAVYGEGKYQEKTTGNVCFPDRRDIDLMQTGVFDFLDEEGRELVPLATDESAPVNPLSTYAITKYAQERMILNTCTSLGIGALALRYQNVYGPGQSLKNPYTGIVSIFSAAILKKQNITVFEDGLPTRDFVYIDDVVEANIRALESDHLSNVTINIGTGKPVTILDVVHTLAKHLNTKPIYNISGDFRAGDIRHNFAEVTRMASLLGFSAKTSFDEGTKGFVSWLSDNMNDLALNTRYADSLNEMRSKGLLVGSK